MGWGLTRGVSRERGCWKETSLGETSFLILDVSPVAAASRRR